MKDNPSPLVSVIVPVYNVEKYVKRCLDSITSQTYTNLEIIVVDDGSTDCSAIICEQCSSEDSRIRVIRKNNEGAGFARNTGIEEASGEYLFFVDSDDYILCNCIERLLQIALQEKADIVKCSWVQGSEERYSRLPKKKRFFVHDNISAFRTRRMNIAIHGKLYKRTVVNGYRYPKITTHDDEFMTYKLVYNAKKIIILDEEYYYYYLSPDSIMRGKRHNQPLQYMKAYDERLLFFLDNGEDELVGISHKEYAIRLMLSYLRYHDYEHSDISEDELLRLYRSEYVQGSNYICCLKERVSLRLFGLMPGFVRLLFNKTKR